VRAAHVFAAPILSGEGPDRRAFVRAAGPGRSPLTTGFRGEPRGVVVLLVHSDCCRSADRIRGFPAATAAKKARTLGSPYQIQSESETGSYDPLVHRSFGLAIRSPWTAIGGMYLIIRTLLALTSAPRLFGDSGSYTWNGWASTVRPHGVALLFDALGQRPAPIVVVQTIVTGLAWLWLSVAAKRACITAVLVARDWSPASERVAVRWGWGLVALILVLSISGPIALWDRTILSEPLAFATMLSAIAWALELQRVPASDRRILFAPIILVCSALVRESTYLAFVAPLIVSVTMIWAVTKIRGQRAVEGGARGNRMTAAKAFAIVALAVVIVPLTLRPSRLVFEQQRGATLENFRNMNVIGRRVLQDPYLQAKMSSAGMPAVDPPPSGPLFAMDEDWRLYSVPGMRDFATDFPTSRYLLAEASRPTVAVRSLIVPSLSSRGPADLLNYGAADELVPIWLSRVLWSWTGMQHLALLAIAATAWFGLRRRGNPTGFGVLILASVVASGGAILAFTLDGMEQTRHAWPFVAMARTTLLIATVIALAFVVSGRPPKRLSA
jgi:hypothetical protein